MKEREPILNEISQVEWTDKILTAKSHYLEVIRKAKDKLAYLDSLLNRADYDASMGKRQTFYEIDGNVAYKAQEKDKLGFKI